MQINAWKKLFAPHILLRGRDYYESGLVEILNADEHGIEAAVEGTDTYSVEIILQRESIVQMDCDCPYADGGSNCKHMAAVLFALEDSDGYEASLPESTVLLGQEDETLLKQAVSELSEEQLRSILLYAARTHSDVCDQILLPGKKAVSPATRKRWAADLHEITRMASDRNGFIDYDHAWDYAAELCQYMDERIKPLMENRLVMDAFELVGMVFTEAMEQEIDDSDGELCLIASSCREYWEELIPSPEADQPKMLVWFRTQLQFFSGAVGEDFLWPLVFEQFTDSSLLPTILEMLDRKIQSGASYLLQGLVERRILLMERMGASDADVEAYRMRFWSQPFIRWQQLDRLEESRSWPEELALLKECERIDAEDRFLLENYSARRVQILKKSGQTQAWLDALKQYIFGFPQRDLSYIIELKQAVPTDQWPALLEQLFLNENTRHLRRQLQLSEGMLEQMMTELEAGSSLYELTQYEKELREVCPERVRDLLVRQLDQQMRRASTRGAYAEAARSVKRLYGYSEGRRKAAELAAAWRRDFPRRTAMLDELKKAKL